MIVKTTRITLVQDPCESGKSKHAATGKACPESTPRLCKISTQTAEVSQVATWNQRFGMWWSQDFPEARDIARLTQQQSHLRSAINRETFRVLVASSTNSLDPHPPTFDEQGTLVLWVFAWSQAEFSLHLETMKIWTKYLEKTNKVRTRINVSLSGDSVMLIFGCFQSRSSRSFRLCRNSASAFLPCSCRT